jgi:phosphoribosylformylglycinamidine cyclo-ligase
MGEAFLAVHRSYAASLRSVLGSVHGIAHITGGGIPGNLIRVLPTGCEAVIDTGSWTLPPLFRLIQRGGQVADEEMREVFNLGVGLIVAAPAAAVDALTRAAAADGVEAWILGDIRAGETRVRFV